MNAYLFDVDGVLSDPKTKLVTEEQLFVELIYLLKKGEPVCLNTGRSLTWVDERIIEPLLEKIEDKTLLERFMAIGEKGATWMAFDQEGNRKHHIDRSITVPQELQEAVKKMVKEKFHESMFYDATKETMISIEMHDNFDISAFHKEQKKLNQALAEILKEHKISDRYKIDPTIIATDVENTHVGKALGSERFLQFLQTLNLKPNEYFAFGDSTSDIEMSDELAKRGEKVTFIFVGDKDKLEGVSRDYKVECVSGFSKGTLAYLTK